jgi:predicted GH43/DUF377 family glycosyl hydrolase
VDYANNHSRGGIVQELISLSKKAVFGSKMDSFQNLGDGKALELESGETVFKLDSCERNPIVRPQDLGLTWRENGELKIGAVFNAGSEFFQDKIMLLPRCHRNYRKARFFDERLGRESDCLEDYISEVWPLISHNGIDFTRFRNVAIRGDGTDHQDFIYGIEDIRIIRHERSYLLLGCGKVKPPFKGSNADRIAIYSTEDFVDITYHGIVEPFDSRNAVAFPEQVNGNSYILLRFHPNIHIGVLKAGIDQLLNPGKHRDQWKEIYEQRSENLLLRAGLHPHENEKIGPGPPLIKTDRGWLLIYHAVGKIDVNICKAYGLSRTIERGYSICAALLDLNEPQEVICRTKSPIYIPSAAYELYGSEEYPVDVAAVVFPVGAVVVQNRLLIYAGAADKYTILLGCKVDKLMNYLFQYCRL